MTETIQFNTNDLLKIFYLTSLSFILAFVLTPVLTHFLYKFKAWKQIREGSTPVFTALHAKKAGTPTMGGILVWFSVAVVTLIFNLSRNQTWLPLFTLVATGILGFFDDYLNIRGFGPVKGLRARHKLILQLLIGAVGAWWFFYKLGFDIIHIPGVGDFNIGWWYIPLFIFIITATTNAVNITDGLDGLAGGLLGLSYTAYTIISLVQGNVGIAAFCGSIAGALLAFLWFNIYPARFFMGDTGSLALGATLGVIAMLTNSVLVLPVIGLVFVLETLSVIIQITYRKLTGGKKLFRSAPLHHHLEALGWPEPKVTMRLWVIGGVFTIIGLILALIGRG